MSYMPSFPADSVHWAFEIPSTVQGTELTNNTLTVAFYFLSLRYCSRWGTMSSQYWEEEVKHIKVKQTEYLPILCPLKSEGETDGNVCI